MGALIQLLQICLPSFSHPSLAIVTA